MNGLKKHFGHNFAARAFKECSGSEYILGKYGDIREESPDTYSVWVIGLNSKPVAGTLLGVILREAAKMPGVTYSSKNGEGFITGSGTEFVLRMAGLLGVPARRSRAPATPVPLKKYPLGARS